jgi:hypothetical protein
MSEQDGFLENVSPAGSSSYHGKSWRGYLFEFILLFMAVFLGFLAENYRENISEKQQAEELAHNFYDELLADSVAIQWYINARYKKDSALIALKNYALDSSLEKVSRSYVRNYYVGLFWNSQFEPTDVLLEQLKNSGSLSYFKSKELQRLTGNLSECIARMRKADASDADFVQNQILPFHIEHGDQKFYDKITHDGALTYGNFTYILLKDSARIDYQINDLAGFSRKKFNNMVGLYRFRLKVSTSHHYLNYEDINKQLLAELRKEYHIK